MPLSAYVANNSASAIVVTVEDRGENTEAPLLNREPIGPGDQSSVFPVQEDSAGQGEVLLVVWLDPDEGPAHEEPVPVTQVSQQIAYP